MDTEPDRAWINLAAGEVDNAMSAIDNYASILVETRTGWELAPTSGIRLAQANPGAVLLVELRALERLVDPS
jgi:hypothetical protein